MGKRKKKLAVLLAAAMTLTMTCGMTTFAAGEGASSPGVTDSSTTPTTPNPNTPVPTTLPDGNNIEGPSTDPSVIQGSGTETPGTETPKAKISETETETETETGTETETETETETNETEPQGSDVSNTTENTGETPETNETETPTPTEEDTEVSDETDTTNDVVYDTTVEEYVPEPSLWVGTESEEEPFVEAEPSDEFISLGEGKGSYQYTDGNLVLKDVNIELGNDYLPAFDITGTIVINLQGNNNISTKGDGIYVYAGNVTINGDGSLTINCTGEWGSGISVYDGSLTIDGADVTVNSETKYGSDAIYVGNGDINIINGADVTANAKVTGDEVSYTSVYGIHAYNGKINITDSNVTAKADGKISLEGERKDWIQQHGIGIYSQSYDIYSPDSETARPAGITIDNSNVNASGSFAAMLVIGKDGTITIKDSTIVSPDDANIRELMGTISEDPDAAAVQIGAILAKGEGAIDLDAIMEEYYRLLEKGDDAALAEFLTSILDNTVKDVKIVRDSELVTAEKSMIPKTGDSFHAETLLLVLAVSGCICAYLIRKKVIA